MKTIIKGAKYDTETAKLMGNWSNNMSHSDFNWMKESLHRTKSGKYFLHGEGGPNTRYSRSTGQNSWTGGEIIIPMSRKSAQEWAEEHLTADEYEKIFGAVGEGTEQLNVTISAELKACLWVQAEESGKTISEIVEQILKGAE